MTCCPPGGGLTRQRSPSPTFVHRARPASPQWVTLPGCTSGGSWSSPKELGLAAAGVLMLWAVLCAHCPLTSLGHPALPLLHLRPRPRGPAGPWGGALRVATKSALGPFLPSPLLISRSPEPDQRIRFLIHVRSALGPVTASRRAPPGRLCPRPGLAPGRGQAPPGQKPAPSCTPTFVPLSIRSQLPRRPRGGPGSMGHSRLVRTPPGWEAPPAPGQGEAECGETGSASGVCLAQRKRGALSASAEREAGWPAGPPSRPSCRGRGGA